jgi:hypothetical protein
VKSEAGGRRRSGQRAILRTTMMAKRGRQVDSSQKRKRRGTRIGGLKCRTLLLLLLIPEAGLLVSGW